MAEPMVLCVARETVPHMPLHLSTQANTLNAHAAAFWHQQGVQRIVLARELTADQISNINILDKMPEYMVIHCHNNQHSGDANKEIVDLPLYIVHIQFRLNIRKRAFCTDKGLGHDIRKRNDTKRDKR